MAGQGADAPRVTVPDWDARPLWADGLPSAVRAALDPGVPVDLDTHPEVLVIGGGVVGLAVAVWCRRLGFERVLVTEQAHLAAGATGGAGGALAPELHQLTNTPSFVALARTSLALYRQLDEEWGGEFELRWGSRLILSDVNRPSGTQTWGPGVEILTRDQVAELVPELASPRTGVLARGQAQVHPLRLAAALARRAGVVATGIRVHRPVTAGRRIVRVPTTAGDLHPGVVVVATGVAPEPWVSLPQRRIKGHLIATEPVGFRLRCGVHAPDLGVGPLGGGGLLAGGTVEADDHSPEVRLEVVEMLRRRVCELLPAVGDLRLTHRWCCFRPAAADGQPVIGRVSGLDNAWVSVGHGGTGVLMAAATGQALAGWIASGRPPLELEPFRPERFG